MNVQNKNTTSPASKTSTPASPSIVSIPKRSAASRADRRKPGRPWYKSWLPFSAALVIALPTLLVGVYLFFFASPRYAVETHFAVRAQEAEIVDPLGMASSLAGPTQTASDSYILTDYLLSRQVVEDLSQEVDLKSIYSNSEIDLVSRFSDNEMEYLVEYWQSMTEAYFDSTRGIISVEVTAYRPEQAKQIAEHLVRLAKILVNQLSEEARADALRGALADVERAEARVRDLRAEMREFRERRGIADPVASAGSAQEKIALLKSELSQIETQLSSSLVFLSEDAPSVSVLRARREAVRDQLSKAHAEIDGSDQIGGDSAVAGMLSEYEKLATEREFAEAAYQTALASLERARGEADRRQRYLAVFVQPREPELAKYPRIVRSLVLTFLLAALSWVLGVMVYYGVREHTV